MQLNVTQVTVVQLSQENDQFERVLLDLNLNFANEQKLLVIRNSYLIGLALTFLLITNETFSNFGTTGMGYD